MKLLDSKLRPYLLVGTKCDKKTVKDKEFSDYMNKYQMINSFIHLTSSKKNLGIN